MTILIGCDPEIFLTRDDSIVSSIGLIGGSKEQPLQVDQGALLEDNVLAEINIHPARTSSQFISRINSVMAKLKDITSCDVVVKSSHIFDKEYLQSQPSAAFEFGCETDYNVYEDSANERPNPYTCLRTAGGHIHVGADDIDLPKLVKTMDLYLGVRSVLMDDDTERRAMYGKAGCYRPKSYGVEYRTLSNFWLKSDELMKWVYDLSIKAVNDHKGATLPNQDTVIHCINTSDKGLAKEISDEYGLE